MTFQPEADEGDESRPAPASKSPSEHQVIQGSTVLVRRIAIAIGLLGCVAIGLVFPFPVEGRLWGEIFNLAHAPVFCGTLLLIVGLCDPSAVGFSNRYQILLSMTCKRAVAVAVGLIAAGIGAEVIQKLVGRSASLGDVAANSAGLLAGLCWVLRCRSQPIAVGRKYVLAGLMTLTLVSVPSVLEIWDCVLQIRSFPVLASFERAREFRNWDTHGAEVEQSNQWATAGKSCAKLRLLHGDYPGMLMTWFERDWSNYSSVHLDLKNTEEFDLQIVFKVYDRQHVDHNFADDDRFHEAVRVPAGQEISLTIPLEKIQNSPANRQMDLTNIGGIDLFAVHLSKPAVLLVDGLLLEE